MNKLKNNYADLKQNVLSSKGRAINREGEVFRYVPGQKSSNIIKVNVSLGLVFACVCLWAYPGGGQQRLS